jgi:predicted ribosome quality control (RQC) complex YloA/Tae2 family protein
VKGCGSVCPVPRPGLSNGELFQESRDKRSAGASRDLFQALRVEKEHFPPETHDRRTAGGALHNNHADRGGEKYLRDLLAMRAFDIQHGYHRHSSCTGSHLIVGHGAAARLSYCITEIRGCQEMAFPETSQVQARLRLLRKHLSRGLRRLRSKLEKQRAELKETERAAWYRQIADSLLAGLSGHESLRRDSSKISLYNIHTQKEEPVALNPTLDVKKNAALFYKKAKKGMRGNEINIKKIAETETKLQTYERLLGEADAALAAGNEVPDLCIEIASALNLPQSGDTPGAASKADRKEKIPYRHLTINDWNIYIGKNDAQNDEMTTRFARPHDLWLHVAGHAGSHVVIRRPDRTTDVPQDVVRKAASLAVWFSKAKHTSYAEVNFTETRFVHKRRHAPAGEVIVERCKSIRVNPCSPEDLFPSKYGDTLK